MFIQSENHRTCLRCGLSYDWRKSVSSLKMSYCDSKCEKADIGTTIEAILQLERIWRLTDLLKEAAP